MVERIIYFSSKEILMKIVKANKIIIFGGGTSGWLTAAYLTKNLQFPCEITLIESTEIGPIGVGEGTQPATARFLYDCGIDPKTWMKPSNAVFKLGVEFVGWTDKNFFVDNDFIENTQIGPNLFAPDYFIGKEKEKYFDWLPAYQLAKENKSPKLAGMDTNYAQTGDRQFGAVHFSAFDIVASLKEIIGDKIKYFDTKIVKVETDNDGISALIDESGRSHTASLYIDCSGFSSVLLEKNLGVEFLPVTDILPCDRAVAIPTQYTDPVAECRPMTTATAMTAGWRWTIPIFTRVGNGYVYSSKYLTPEEAEQELRQAIGEHTAEARHLTMKCGIHKVIAYKNVCAAGLAAGFVEPLEATGITFTTKAVELLTAILNQNQGIWSNAGKNALNDTYSRSFWEIVAFVWAHYHFSKKTDTDFWRTIHRQSPDTIPQIVLDIVAQYAPNLSRKFFLNPDSNFHVGHWFQVLHAAGVYDQKEEFLKDDVMKYAEYFIKNNTYRVEQIKEYFPNHYEFLKEWYGD
jgi:2-polyprenyl-6-methoxyphenol hydroxylase-like FAD-dependent oxidoreductase